MKLNELKSELKEKEKDLINIRLFNKGDYEIIKDDIPGIRGKFILGESIKNGLLWKGKASCEYD